MAISDGIKKKLDRYKGTSQTQDKTQSNSALAKLNQYKRDNTEANYNRAMEEYNAIATEQKKTHDEYMSYDADAGKNELDNLAKVMENYNARNKMSVGGVDRGLADNVIKQAGYENYSDFEKDYYTKKNYYNEATAYQTATRLEESLKKLDEMDKTEYGNLAEQGKLNYAQEAVDRKNQRNGFQNKVLDPILNAMGVRDPQNVNWSWSEEELNTYFALRETDSQAADTYFRYLKEKDNQAKIDTVEKNLGLDAAEKTFGEDVANAAKTFASVPMSAVGIADLGADALQYMAYGDIGDTSVTGAGYAADKWQQESAERLAEETAGTAWDLASKAPILAKMTGIDNLAVALQSTGLSMAQSYAFMQTMGAAGTVFLAGSAGSNALRESLESGDSPEVAMGYGIASGIFEGVFEYISLEKVLKPKDSNGWKTFIKNLFKSAVAEGSEEVWTEISDKIADICLRKDNSEWALAKAEYYATHSDASAANAEFYAFRKAFGDVNAAFIGGFASGGIMGGASSSMAQMKKISDANTVVGNYAENKSGLVNMIKETAATTGQNYADNLTEESSDKDIRNAVIESQKSISNDAIARRLAELDVDSDTALATADAIRKNAMDFYLTSEEKELLKTAEAKQVASEYSSGSGWTSELNATLEAFSYPSKTAVGDINDVYTNENTPKAEIKPVENATPLTDEQKRFLTDIGRTDMIAQNEADVDSVTAEDSIRSFAKANDINADDLITEFSSLKETRPYLTSTAYLNALDLAETYGKLGASYSDTVKNVGFKSEQMGKAYNAGIENYKLTRTDAYKEAEKRKKGFAPFDGKSHLATEQELSAAAIYGGEAIADAESLSDEVKAQMGFWQEFYKGTSVTVAFFRGSGREGDANGGYHKQSNTVFIDVNDDIIRNGLHEYVHTMSENTPKLYDELREYVIGALFDGSEESFVNEVERKYASYNSILKEQWLKTHDDLAGYKEYSRENCAEEVIAESTKTAFDDIDKVVDFAENHKGLFNRLLDFFKKMANILKSAIAKYGTTNKFAEALARDEQAVNRVIDIMMRAREGMKVNSLDAKAEQYLNENGFEVGDGNIVYSINYNSNTLTEEQRNKVIGGMMRFTGKTRAECERFLKDEATMSLALKGGALDFEANPFEMAIKKNSDYPQGTIDLTNNCPKRMPVTRITNRLQAALPDDLFTADDYADIRLILMDDGRVVACGLCFVEDRRQLLGEIAKEFMGQLSDAVKNKTTLKKVNSSGKLKDIKIGKDLAKRYGVKEGTVRFSEMPKITQSTFVNSDEWFKLQKNSPYLAAAYEAYNNARGQQAGRLILDRAEYKRELLNYTPEQVKNTNDVGGLRIFSFSDFEAVHMMDLIQIIQDCAAMGIKIQGYTKQIDFVKLALNTGIKLNCSTIPYGATGLKVVKGKKVAALDTVEGIDVNDPIVKKAVKSNDIGFNVTGINDEQIRVVMADKFFSYIIPFHSNKSGAQNKKLGVGAWTNYKPWQVDKQAGSIEDIRSLNKRMTELRRGGYSDTEAYKQALKELKDKITYKAAKKADLINIYTEVLNDPSVVNEETFTTKFLEVCKNKNLVPRFAQFLDTNADGDYVYTPGYAKFLVDFKLFDDNGNIVPQGLVTPDFSKSVMKEIVSKEMSKTEAERAGDVYPEELYEKVLNYIKVKHGYEGNTESYNELKSIVDKMIAKTNRDEDGTKGIAIRNGKATINPTNYSLKDSEGNSLTKAQADYFKDSKVRDKGGNLLKVYHGTDSKEEFFTFRKMPLTNGKVHGEGFYFTPDKNTAYNYGSRRVIEAYLNLTNPLYISKDIPQEILDIAKENFGKDYDRYSAIKTWWGNRYTRDEYIEKAAEGVSDTDSALFDAVDMSDVETDNNDEYETIRGERQTELLKSLGYDGVIVPPSGRYKGEYVVFDSNQAKLTSNENPTADPDVRYSINLPDNAEDIAKKYFGTTNNWRETGWIITDGSQLDFSGRHWQKYDDEISLDESYYNNERNSEHYEVLDAFNGFGTSTMANREEALNEFIGRGNIRIDGKYGIAEMDVEPTEAQYEKLYQFFNQYKAKYPIVVGYRSDYRNDMSFPEGTNSSAIIESIREHFKNKSASDVARFHSMYSIKDSEYAPTFYSQMGKIIDTIKMDKIGSASVIPFLKGKGIKDEEIKWSGIETFLAGKKSVTKAELQEFVVGSSLKIEEEVLGAGAKKSADYKQADKEMRESKKTMDSMLDNLAGDYANRVFKFIKKYAPDYNGEHGELFSPASYQNLLSIQNSGGAPFAFIKGNLDRLMGYWMSGNKELNEAWGESELRKELNDNVEKYRLAREKYLAARSAKNAETQLLKPKWEKYKVAGGGRYSEIKFKLPGNEYQNNAMKVHWNDTGVLAHARVQDMKTADGKKMLFIDEIQSDWHNAGAKNGYADVDIQALNQAVRDADHELAVAQQNFAENEKERIARMSSAIAEWYKNHGRFVNETVVQDQIAHNPAYVYQQYAIQMNNSGKTNDFEEAIGKDIADWFSKWYNRYMYLHEEHRRAKDTARKYRDITPDAPFRNNYTDYVVKRLLRIAAEGNYDSLGWTTAKQQSSRWSDQYAEGYRIEYDQDIPKFLDKYGKKWGGRVDKATLSNGEEVWNFTIPEAMKESVLYEGQPMYSLRGNGYDGYSMSNNARDAYENGQKPWSAWKKRELLEAVKKINPSRYELASKMSVDELKKTILSSRGWHHTSKFYNKTTFYEVTEETVAHIGYHIDYELSRSGTFRDDNGYHELWYSDSNATYNQNARKWEYDGEPIPLYNDYVVHYSLREAKQGYVDARNRENAEIKTLTQEQHNALADLARIRHEFHSSIESYWNTESNADWTIFDTDGKINTLLRNANLPTIDFGDYTDVPTSDDYYYVLDESEREMYSDPQDWKERSGAYLEFSDRMAQINDIIESYLRAVDKEHGTSYAPTGFARLAYSLRDTITDRELLAEALDSHITNAEDRKTLAKYKMTYNESLKRADTIASLKSQLANETDANRQAVLKKQINEQQNELNKRNAELKSILTMPRMIAIVKDMREEVARYQWALQEADDNLLKEQIKNGRLSVKLQAQIKAKEDKYQRYKNNTIERRGINYYRPRIEKSYNELVKMATDKSKKYPLADAFKEPIMNIISALNFVKTGSETNKAARLLTAQQALNKLAQETASTEKFLEKYGHLLPEDMPEWIRTVSGYLSEAYEFIGPINVANMNSEQLASLYHLLKTVEMTAKQASKSYTSKAVDMSDVAKETMLYTDSLAKDKDLPRILRGVRNFMTWQNAQPITVFERMGEGGEKIFKLLSNGQSKLAFNTKDIENKVAELKDKYGITDKQIRGWYKDEIEITIGGDEMTVPTAFIAELHCLLKDEDAYRHVISGGGIQLADIEHTTKVNKDIAPHKMTELEIADIESKLNPDVRAFIDEMHKYLADKGAEWGNEVSVARYGFEAFGIKNYYPIKTIRSLENDAKMKEENPNNIYGLLNKSFTKERHFNAKNAIVIGNFFETFARHMGEMATYNAYALPVLDTVRWLNHKQSSYDADGKPTETSVQQSLRGAYGNEIIDYINKLLTSINGTHSSDTSGFLAYLRMTNRVAVAANIRVAIQQPLSIVRAFDEINPKYVSIPSNLKETYAEMIEHSGIALWKDMGYYDTNVSRSLTSKLYAEDGYKGTMDKITEKTMVLAEKGDQFTWAILWNACKNEVAEKGLEGDAYWKAVTERFESIIYHTQVVDSMLTRSQWMRGNDYFHRITSSFKAEPTTTYNALLRLVDKFDRAARTSNIQEAWAKTKGAFLRTVAVVGLSAIVQAIATAAIDMLRDDDDYETPFEKWWAAFVSNLGDNTLVVGSIPVVSDLVDVFKGYDSSRPDTEWLSNVINLAKRIANAIKNNSWDAKTTYKLVQAASEISGFPIANAMRDLVGIWNHVIGTIDSSLKIQFSPEPNSLGYENYYKAYTEGKMARAEEIIVEMESNNISEQAMWNGLVGKMREDYRAGNKSAEEAREYLATTAALIGIERTDKQITKLIEGW